VDERSARKLAGALAGQHISDWKVGSYLGCGKSALVCQASKDEQQTAIRIYDSELIEKFGKEAQARRIDRQLELVGKRHPHLIEVYGGGYCKEADLFYLVMELVESKNLEQAIGEVPRDRIGPIICQVASAARYLDELGMVHRDIKPSNIMVTADFQRAVLTDLGVLRPISGERLTDSSKSQAFIATLRYSSPEYLLREEEETGDGYRALTFYQLGAVLHDLIMRRPLFLEHSEPYPRLVRAVREVTPIISAPDVDMEIAHLARKCLVKNPKVRLDIVHWEDFDFPRECRATLGAIKARISERIRSTAGWFGVTSSASKDRQRKLEQCAYDIRSSIETCVRDVCGPSGLFPRRKVSAIGDKGIPSVIVRVIFEKSESHCLDRVLDVSVAADILELHPCIVQLQWSALLSRLENPYSPGTMSQFYEGVFDGNLVKNRLDSLLHAILDRAQEICASGNTGAPTNPPGDPVQLILRD
jgi:serine/threonine protein kinase